MPKEFKSFFKTVGGNEGNKCHYPTRLDTYGCGCQHDCSYCVSPDTEVLMWDGTKRPIRDVEVGDEIVGVTFNGTEQKTVRHISRATVLAKVPSHKRAYRIHTSDGVVLTCSGDHRWFTDDGWKYVTDGADGDGRRPHLVVSDRLYRVVDYEPGTPAGRAGEVRSVPVVKIEDAGDEIDMLDITTSTENFFADGFLSHNCYAKSLLGFRNLWNPDDPSVADVGKIRRKIARLDPETTPALRLGGMTDCFQPAEKEHGVTYETIKALNERGLSYLIVTKSPLVATDKYLEVLDRDLAHIQVSVTSTDAETSRTFERAPEPELRIGAIERLFDEGFDVALRLSPYIPDYIDVDVINAVRCDKLLVEFLRVNTWIRRTFDIDYTPYTHKQGGYRHLPLETKVELIKPFLGHHCVTVCEDVDEHYDYWRENLNPNPDDCCNLSVGRR